MALDLHRSGEYLIHYQVFSADKKPTIAHLRHDIELWCKENIGPTYFDNNNYLVFNNPEDEMAFILRWK